MAFLAQHHHVYLIDLVGFGAGRRQRFYLQQAAPLLAAWMERVGLSAASVIGHSMGGFIAIDLASRYPEKVERLVLVDAAALPMGRNRVQTAVGLARAVWVMPRNFLPILFGDSVQAGPRTLLRAARELLGSDLTDKLSAIHVPTLVVWGDQDWLVPLHVGLRLYDSLDNAELVVLDDAGHNPMWDQSTRFNQIVEDFLQQRPIQKPFEAST